MMRIRRYCSPRLAMMQPLWITYALFAGRLIITALTLYYRKGSTNMHKTLEDIARELGGTVGKTRWNYTTERKPRNNRRDNKTRTKQLRQARELKASL